MTEEELMTAITVRRNKFEARISVAKSFLTPEQMKVFRSKPFVRERNDKPRWDCNAEDERARARYKKRTGSDADWLPIKRRLFGRIDYLHHSRVVLAQVLRLMNGDYEPKVRVVPPRKHFSYVNKGDEIA